ncbi:MAG TPA: response regulator transcription factor [Gaiellaceae bacterium]|nr:response regulator transcription factor [Gaiellaceae bacterium]
MDYVLVVDDDPAFCERIVAFLQELLPGHDVVAVGDGNAALTRALELRPKHVILDVSMPGPNGLRVANALTQALPSTNIVIVSGSEELSPVDVPAGTVYVRKDERMEDTLRALLT